MAVITALFSLALTTGAPRVIKGARNRARVRRPHARAGAGTLRSGGKLCKRRSSL